MFLLNLINKFPIWFIAGTVLVTGTVGYFVVSPQFVPKPSESGYGGITCPSGKVLKDKICQ